jgi:hypothetical protein
LPCPHLEVEEKEGDVVFLRAVGIVTEKIGDAGDAMEEGEVSGVATKNAAAKDGKYRELPIQRALACT